MSRRAGVLLAVLSAAAAAAWFAFGGGFGGAPHDGPSLPDASVGSVSRGGESAGEETLGPSASRVPSPVPAPSSIVGSVEEGSPTDPLVPNGQRDPGLSTGVMRATRRSDASCGVATHDVAPSSNDERDRETTTAGNS